MTTESLPDDCLPPNVNDMLRGPQLDSEGRIIGGTFAGMTPAQVIAERDAYNRACESGDSLLRKLRQAMREE